MAYVRDNEAEAAAARGRRMKGVFAACVIVACMAFVTWSVWPKPQPYVPPPDNPAANWLHKYGELSAEHAKNSGDAYYWATAAITTEPTADNQGVIIRGSVKTAAELELLKSETAKVQPAVPIEWQVRIGH